MRELTNDEMILVGGGEGSPHDMTVTGTRNPWADRAFIDGLIAQALAANMAASGAQLAQHVMYALYGQSTPPTNDVARDRTIRGTIFGREVEITPEQQEHFRRFVDRLGRLRQRD